MSFSSSQKDTSSSPWDMSRVIAPNGMPLSSAKALIYPSPLTGVDLSGYMNPSPGIIDAALGIPDRHRTMSPAAPVTLAPNLPFVAA